MGSAWLVNKGSAAGVGNQNEQPTDSILQGKQNKARGRFLSQALPRLGLCARFNRLPRVDCIRPNNVLTRLRHNKPTL